MLFNSIPFLAFFLPATLAGYFLLGRLHSRWAGIWLFFASLFFYGWWDSRYVALLLLSILVNFLTGRKLCETTETWSRQKRKILLLLGIGFDLGLLGYYKYFNFFMDTVSATAGLEWSLPQIILPLGISFYTFTQIAFLVDAWSGQVREYNFFHYGLFVTFFPHLIAGPILHHKEMMPQFDDPDSCKPRYDHLAAGLTLLALGLFKKVVIADSLSPLVAPVFNAPGLGITLTFLDSWLGALSYTLQLYFDFSGYCDMAVGLSLMFGIRLPLNFFSPYKAVSITDFWRRWHMTLSRFFRDYLYIPMGGNQCGPGRQSVNLILTMLLGGLWHGANWTFVVWGGVHGMYLAVHHAWSNLRRSKGWDHWDQNRLYTLMARTFTFAAVVVAWVIFRADSLNDAGQILGSMFGLNGIQLPDRLIAGLGPIGQGLLNFGVIQDGGTLIFNLRKEFLWLIGVIFLIGVAWWTPNTTEIMRRVEHALSVPALTPGRIQWKPTPGWAVLASGIMILTTLLILVNENAEFLYYQF